MNAKETMLFVDTAIGVIALPLNEALVAHDAALEILGDLRPTAVDRQTIPSLLDASTISELFGIDPSWFLSRARENRIPHVRIGKFVRFDPAEIREFFHRKVDRLANS